MGSLQKYYKSRHLCPTQVFQFGEDKSLDKIPIMSKSPKICSSDTLLFKTKSKMDKDKSCPNLIIRRNGSSLSSFPNRHWNNIFSKELFYGKTTYLSSKLLMENQCRKLKKELLKMQSHSPKKHAILSRKFGAVNKEKKT